jgi:N-acetylglutamate synthase-like GNAT family acetyltransferase
MKVESLTHLTDKSIKDIFTLSVLMEKAENRHRAYTFFEMFAIMSQENGVFFISKIKSKKSAFGFFAKSINNDRFRRLTYFAVKCHKRRKGIGQESLNLVLKKEITKGVGCTLACAPELEKFYNKTGFSKICNANNTPNEIVMAYETSGLLDNNTFCQVRMSDKKLFKNSVIEIEKRYGINLETSSL